MGQQFKKGDASNRTMDIEKKTSMILGGHISSISHAKGYDQIDGQ